MQIWMAASEMAPYAKTGGLADVLADLPAALAGAGAEVTCVLPFYRAIWEKIEVEDLGMDLSIELGDRQVRARILQGRPTTASGCSSFAEMSILIAPASMEPHVEITTTTPSGSSSSPRLPVNSRACSISVRISFMPTTGRPPWFRCSSSWKHR